jgi:hypothetical protein
LQLATRGLWLPSPADAGGEAWVDTVTGVETRAPAGAQGISLNRSYALWEVPAFASSAAMIPLAPDPGAAGGGALSQGAPAQSPLGGAAREPQVVSWEMWPGASASGAGELWEAAGGATSAAFAVSGASLRLTFGAPKPGAPARTHRFEVQNVPPAVSVSACSASTTILPLAGGTGGTGGGGGGNGSSGAAAGYDGRTLQLAVQASVAPPAEADSVAGADGADGADGCVLVQFGAPLNGGGQVDALRALPYRALRTRLHVLKQRFDDLQPQPCPHLMPIVDATNTATRLNAACAAAARAAAAAGGGGQAGGGAHASWVAELQAFPARVDAALGAVAQWRAEPGRKAEAQAAADAFAAVARAWICTAELPPAVAPLANCAA